jgi:hypothetical protein
LKPTGVDRPLAIARADCAPSDQVAEELRADRVERLGARGQAQFVDVAQDLAGKLQAFGDVERVVHVRVVDQALPAGGGARFLEIHAHHDEQRIGDFVGDLLQPPGVIHRGIRIMDRARADHDHQAVILAIQDALQGVAAFQHRALGPVGERDPALDLLRGEEHVLGSDVDVINQFFVHFGCLPDSVSP